jgi:hypothetical protein
VNPFIATGNTFSATNWGGGEAIIRFQSGPLFSGLTNHYWAPTNWKTLDNGDTDLGGSGPLLVEVPGAAPEKLVVALGKDGNAYLLDRTNLGGISPPLAKSPVGSGTIIQAAAAYQTSLGTYVAFRRTSSQLTAFRITATSPPTITTGWTVTQNGRGSPFVTSTDGTNNVIVWVVGCEGDQRLHGYEGDTGNQVYAGGGASELMAGTRRFGTSIAARGRIYVANDNKVYAFAAPVPPVTLSNPTLLPGGFFQFSFVSTPGLSFTAFGATNLALSFSNWSLLGNVTDSPPGQFQFTDPEAATNLQRFYRVRSP